MLIEPLDSEKHNRLAFSCGNEKLDRFLHETARQNKRKGLSAVFVAVDESDPTKVLGYSSLSSFMIAGLEIPDILTKKRGIPKHVVPATLIGRLAVDSTVQGRRIGETLLMDALKKSFASAHNIGSVCVIVDAIEEDKVGFYEKYGLIRARLDGFRLFLMMDTIAELIAGPRVAMETQQAG